MAQMLARRLGQPAMSARLAGERAAASHCATASHGESQQHPLAN